MTEGHELGKMNNSTHRSLGGGTFSGITAGTRYRQKDESDLARLGKKQALKRRFGFVSLFGFSCTILITWETALALFQQAFRNGGPAGLVWGFVIAWSCTMSVYIVIAEMASIAPIAGGQYFWVSILAPPKYKRFLSYMTGWLTSIAWVATLATGSIFVGGIIQGMMILNRPSYKPQPYHATLLSFAVIFVAVFINTVISSLLPIIEGFILIFHVLGFFAILITLVYMAPHGKASTVFTTSLNAGNWPTQGISYCVGFIGNVATFVGADASVHMSEEIENASWNVPRAIITTMVLNGAMGWAMVIAALFCLGDDPQSVLETPTGFPFIQIFYNGTQSIAGATAMTALIDGLAWCAVIGFLATASRMTWSFARDRGLPFHRFVSKVEPRTSIPVMAIVIVTLIPCLLALIRIGSATVYDDIISLSVSGLYASYFIPCAFLLWRRSTGQMTERSELLTTTTTTVDDVNNTLSVSASAAAVKKSHKSKTNDDHGHVHGRVVRVVDDDYVIQPRLVWGPWRIRGIWGTINNAFACLYIVLVIFWSFWPPATPVKPETMNYSVLVTGSVIIFSLIYYRVWGKTQYLGPLVDQELINSVARQETRK